MNPVTGLLGDPTVMRLAMVLLHFFWQGCLFALAAMVILAVLRKAAPQLRYLMLLGLFVLMSASPVVTFYALPAHASLGELESTVVQVADGGRRFATPEIEVPPGNSSGTLNARDEGLPPSTDMAPAPLDGETTDRVAFPLGDTHFDLLASGNLSWGAWLVVAWSGGVALLSMRLLYGLLAAEWLKRRGVQPIDQAYNKMARRIQRQLGIWREVPVLVSIHVNVPTLVGYLKPVILMPTSAMLGLTPQQFEAILAHEFSHVARHDYLTNVLQCVVETLLFYHPVVWWMSRRLRHERELCCVDMATAICDDRQTSAQAICIVAQARNAATVPAMAATGSPIVRRIKRLAERDDGKSSQRSGWFAALVMTGAVSLLGVGLQATVAATEESGSRMELHAPGGIVDIEIFDGRVEIGFDSETGMLSISGAGPNDIKIKLGPQQFPRAGGEQDNWLTITRGEKPVVRFRLRSVFIVNDLKLERSFFNQGPPSYSVDFSSDGKQLICGGYFGAPFTWLDAGVDNVINTFGDSHAPVFVSFSPDGLHAAAGCIDGKVLVWNLETEELVQEFSHGSMITAIEYSPDGQRLATGALDESICVWDLQEERELLRYIDHKDYIFDLAFSPTGNQVASVSADATLRIWDSTNGQTEDFMRHPAPVWSVAYSNDGRRIVTGAGGKLIGKAWKMNVESSKINLGFVWNTSTGEELLRFQGHRNVIKDIDVSPDGRYAITASLDRTLRLWDMQTGMELIAVPGQGWVTSAQFSPDGRKVAASGGIRYENGRAIHYPVERLRLFSLVNFVPYVGASRQKVQPPRLDVFDAGSKELLNAFPSGEVDSMVLDAVLRAATGFDDAREELQILEVAATKWPLDLSIRKRLNHHRIRFRDIESLLKGSGSFDTQLAGQRISQREHLPQEGHAGF